MEYSLQTLNQNSKLNSLTVTEVINKLNLIGFEVDNIFDERSCFSSFIESLRLVIKIPANREDLLNEKFFFEELSNLFLLENYELSKNTKKIYFSFLLKKYFQYYKFENIKINSNLSNIVLFNIEISNFQNYSSPLWLQDKLKNSGLKSTQNLDDFLNLITFEWGQKFNTSKNIENNLNLKKIYKKEILKDTNNINYKVYPGNLVLLNDKNQLVSLLGNFNLLNENLNGSLNSIILQSVFYNENNQNSNIFEKTISLRYFQKIFLKNYKFSFQRLLTLLEINSSIVITPKIYSIIGQNIVLKSKKILKLKKETLKYFLNIENYNFEILKKFNLKIVCKTNNEIYFLIPESRKDLNREIDLIEEYSRFIGYKNFNEILPLKEQKKIQNNNNVNHFIKQFFINYGFNEIVTNPILDNKKDVFNMITINNPLNLEFINLRTTLLIKIVEIFSKNIKSGFEINNFFEIGRTFEIKNNTLVEFDKLALIFQIQKSKKSLRPNSEWFIAKGFIENFFLLFGYNNLSIEKIEENLSLFHPKKSISFTFENQIIGTFGQINPKVQDLETSKYITYIFECNLENFKNFGMKSKIKSYKEISKFVPITKDLSFLVDDKIDFLNLRKKVEMSSLFLTRFEYFDFYFDENLKNKVSIGIRLEFGSNLINFTNEIIEEELNKIKQDLIKTFDVILR
jgi:phenylalanyl-tRNA synthetase beta chain